MTDHTAAPPARLTVLDGRNGMDWATFAAHHADRGPVLVKGVTPPPFRADEVFAAAVTGTTPPSPGIMAPNAQVTLGRYQQSAPGPFLPRAEDGSLDGYAARMARERDGERYALVVHGFHACHFPLWRRAAEFLSGLWEHTGQPLTGGTITTLFHGNYHHSPVGVHEDRFATFMFALHGRKRMRFWPTRPWSDPVSTVLDYEPYLDSSFTADAEPGDLLYWPADYYHVGESDLSDQPATSVNIGIPRTEHRGSYDVQEYLYGTTGRLMEQGPPASAPGERARPLLVPPDQAGTELDGELPPAVSAALDRLTAATATERVTERTAAHSLEHLTSGGLTPAPPPAPLGPLDDGDILRVTVEPRWEDCGTTRFCAANGRVVRTPLAAEQLSAVLAALRAGPQLVGDLLARAGDGPGTAAEVRLLLRELVSLRALAPSGAGQGATAGP